MTTYKVVGKVLGVDIRVTILTGKNDWHFAQQCAIEAIRSGKFYCVEVVSE